MSLADFLSRVAAELGVTIPIASPPSELSDLPPSLHELYSLTDGLQLPFAELHPVSRLHSADPHFGTEWLAFGFDGYFTHYLVTTIVDAAVPIAAFDPEAEARPEASYASVLELLEDEYSRYVDNEFRAGDLYITSVPDSTPLPRVVQELRRITPLGSAELLRELRSMPLILDPVNAAAGIRAVRKLHALGVAAHLKNVRPERAG